MLKEVKIGIIGCGDIVKVKHLRSIEAVEGACLVSVCDIVEEKAREMCKLGNAVSWYTSYEKMLEEADIDAVIVATPHPFHTEPVIKAAKAGKHILVEKPMAVKRDDVYAMTAAAKEANVKFVILPFVPNKAYMKCKEIISRGLIGEIVNIEAISITAGAPPMPWYISDQAGIGSLANIGIYSITPVVGLIEPVSNVLATTSRSTDEMVMRDGKVYKLLQEDNSRVILTWGNGKIASITCGWWQGEGKSRVVIYGREGVLVLDSWGFTNLLINPKSLDIDLPELKTARTVESFGKIYYEIVSDRNFGEVSIEYFIEAIKEDKDLSYDLKIMEHVMDIVFKAYESAANGVAVKL